MERPALARGLARGAPVGYRFGGYANTAALGRRQHLGADGLPLVERGTLRAYTEGGIQYVEVQP